MEIKEKALQKQGLRMVMRFSVIANWSNPAQTFAYKHFEEGTDFCKSTDFCPRHFFNSSDSFKL